MHVRINLKRKAVWDVLQVIKVVEAKKVVTWRFYMTKLMPIGLFMAATLHFGNLVYLHLTVAFIQILKVRPSFPFRTLFMAATAYVGTLIYLLCTTDCV